MWILEGIWCFSLVLCFHGNFQYCIMSFWIRGYFPLWNGLEEVVELENDWVRKWKKLEKNFLVFQRNGNSISQGQQNYPLSQIFKFSNSSAQFHCPFQGTSSRYSKYIPWWILKEQNWLYQRRVTLFFHSICPLFKKPIAGSYKTLEQHEFSFVWPAISAGVLQC